MAPKGYGVGTYSATKCHWDCKNDNYLTIRWENETMFTIVTVFGTGLFTVAGWPKDEPQVLCKYTSRKYELKHLKEKAAHDLAWAEAHRNRLGKHRHSVFVSARARELAMKRSRRYMDEDMGANKYNCVDEDDVIVFEDVEQAINDFREILYNPNYYKIEEDAAAAIVQAELDALAEAEEEEEEEEELRALEAKKKERVQSIQF